MLDGLRDIEAMPLLADAIGLALMMVCAVSLVFLMWVML